MDHGKESFSPLKTIWSRLAISMHLYLEIRSRELLSPPAASIRRRGE